jgi:glutathione S-transferase
MISRHMKSRPVPLKLYTFAMSHYSEKIRWTLDHCNIPYREICMTPVFHIGPALRMGKRGQTTLPVLQTPRTAIQDSPRILDWLATNYGPMDIMSAANRPSSRQIEQRFDAIGKDVARMLYAHSFGVADAHILRLWTEHASPLQARIVRRGYPLIRWAFKRKLQINARRAKIAEERINEVVRWLERNLQDGRFYLTNDRFSTADITAAALLAPIACPPEHPVYGDPAFKQAMAQALSPWRNSPAMEWVRAMYKKHRGTMTGGTLLARAA